MVIKNGYYLVNTDLFNKKAHSIQILKTVEAINKNSDINLTIIAPKYSSSNLDELFAYHVIKNKFSIIFVKNFLFSGGGKTSFYFFLIPIFLKILKIRKEIDFIYFRSEYFFILLLFLPSRIKTFYEIHRRGINRKQNFIKNKIVKRVDGVISITNELRKKYLKLNNNIVAAHDAVDLNRFVINIDKKEARIKMNLNQNEKIVMYVGSVTEEKGVDIVLRSATLLPQISFYLLGSVNKKILDEEKSDNVKFFGQVDNDLIPSYLKCADVLLIPHHPSIKFQSPMKLFEYLASGRFIISTNLENIKEVIDEDDALFYKHDHPEDLRDKLNTFFENREKYEGENTKRKKKMLDFTWDKRGEVVSNFIND